MLTMIFSGMIVNAKGEESIPQVEIIDNAEAEILNTDPSEHLGFGLDRIDDKEENIAEEEYIKFIGETSKSSDKYIVKYKNRDSKNESKIKRASKNAFNKGKTKKEKQKNERLKRLENVDESELEKFEITDDNSTANIQSPINFELKQNELIIPYDPEIDVNSLNCMPEIDVISVPESINSEDFVQEIMNESGDIIEYIQPDYIMELSSNDTENIIDIEIDATDINDDEKITDNQEKASITNENNSEVNVNENNENKKENTTDITTQNHNNKPDSEPTPATSESTLEPIIETTETEQQEINSSIRSMSLSDDLQNAWAISRGDGITIAVIDTGIDIAHPDLIDHMINGWDFYNDKSEVYNPDLGMDQAHGTHVAGIIANAAPEAKIMPLKVFENGEASTSDIIKAIEYAKNNGAQIVNCSFGSTDNNQALKEAMKKSGLFFVCAAGNSRTNIDETPVYPAAFGLDNTISVAALNQDLGMSYFSNYGTENVDIATMGRNVESCFPNGQYGIMNGTSMSAAYVSAASALILSIDYQKNLKETLKNTADKLSCLDGKVDNANKVSFYGAVSGEVNNEILQVTPEDDFNVNGYKRTIKEDWELFNSLETIQLDAGGSVTAYLKSDGSVWTMGYGISGQLGNGENVNSAYPVRAIGLSNIIQISVGETHCLALSSSGSVYAWGRNTNKQISASETSSINIPTQISLPVCNIKFVEAGSNNSFVSDGTTVYAWGQNNYGQLGVGHKLSVYYPEAVQNISNITYIDSFGKHTFFISGSKMLYACGSNNHSVLGNPDWGTITSPELVKEYVDKIATGNNHAVAIDTKGYVFAWGANLWGQAAGESALDVQTPQIVFSEDYVGDVKDVKAGSEHSIILSGDNTVITWGRNSGGQLGDGTKIDRARLLEVSGLSNIKMIAAGNGHTIAIEQNGTIWKWGQNPYGQFGNGTTQNSYSPNNEFKVKTLNTKISSGLSHTIMVNEDGTVSTWGNNLYGQLGDSTNTNSVNAVAVIGLNNIVEVTAGEYSSFALDKDGKVWAWGRNSWSMLGDKTDTDRNIPVKLQDLSNIVKISANHQHVLALDKDGNVYTWGVNPNGELGNGGYGADNHPVKINNIPNVIDISAGKNFSLAVDSTGTIWSWGNNNYCKMGIADSGNYPTPVKTTITGVNSVAAGENHSMATDQYGNVYTWGMNNDFGQLGTTTIINYTPQPQRLALTGINNIITKSNTSIAIDGDSVAYAWGKNNFDQLGIGIADAKGVVPTKISDTKFISVSSSNESTYAINSAYNIYKWGFMPNSSISNYSSEQQGSCVPLDVPMASKFIQVDAKRNSVVALDQNGDVYTWGDGAYWDLGHVGPESCSYPQKVKGLPKIISVAKGENHTLAVDVNGKVWGWGKNSSCEVTQYASGNVSSPIEIRGIDNVKSISAGEGFSAAIKKDGTLWTWGNNQHGQLGLSTEGNVVTPTHVLSNVNQVTCGARFMLALVGETVYSWGNNDKGQLGDKTIIPHSSPTAISGNFKKISAGREHVLAISTNGELYSWGSSSVGQLGHNDKISKNIPTKVAAMTASVKDICAAYSHSLAVTTDGNLYTWGEGRSGQMGNGEKNTYRVPKLISSMSGIVSASGGYSFSVVRDNNGKLWSFGNDDYGQLGIKSNKPVSVNFKIDVLTPSENKVVKTINVKNNEDYIVNINAKNISNLMDQKFCVTYDASKLKVVDLICSTYEKENTIVDFTNGVAISSFTEGRIEFSNKKQIPNGKYFTGTINSIKFKSIYSGETTIELEY